MHMIKHTSTHLHKVISLSLNSRDYELGNFLLLLLLFWFVYIIQRVDKIPYWALAEQT